MVRFYGMQGIYVKAYNEKMIRVWNITAHQSKVINLQDQSSLDAITRQLTEGYYSTFRTYDGCTRVLGLKSHLRRLYDPVSMPAVSEPILRRQLITLLEPFRPDEARVRVVMTMQGQVYVALEPLKPISAEVYELGVRAETTKIQRNNPRLKSTAFIGASESERKHIGRKGIFEALLVKNGRILEGMTSNFFYVLRPERSEVKTTLAPDANPLAQVPASAGEGEILFTAHRDILLGVTRSIVIRLARGRGVDVQYQSLKLNQLSDVSEAFITSSSRGVVPVIQIDEVTIGQGSPGKITRMLRAAYDQYVLEYAEKI